MERGEHDSIAVSQPRNWRKWFLWLVIVVFTGITGWVAFQFDLSPSPSKPSPLRVIEYADGTKVEIMGYSVGNFECIENPQRKAFGVSAHSGSTYAHGYFAGGNFETSIKSLGGVPDRWSARIDGKPQPLIIGIRIWNAAAQPLRVDRSFAEAEIYHDSRGNSSSGSRTIDISEAGFTPDFRGTDIASAMSKHGLDWLVEHEDPDSGWVAMSGPLWIGKEFPASHVVVLPAWRRDQKNLRFRMTRNTGERIEFNLPNPAIGVTSPPAGHPAIKAEVPPFVVSAPGYRIRCERIRKYAKPGYYPCVNAEIVFETTDIPADQAKVFFDAWPVSAYDEWGNHVPCMIGKFMRLPASSGHAGIVYEVRRTENHPVDRGEVFLFARGEVMPDGASAKVEMLPAGAKLGIRVPESCAIVPVGDKWYDWLEGDEALAFQCSGKIDPDNLPPPLLGKRLDQVRLVFFSEVDLMSSGRPCFKSSSQSSSNLGLKLGGASVGGVNAIEFTNHTEWRVPQGKLKPGCHFEVGMHRGFEVQTHVLPVRLPPPEP